MRPESQSWWKLFWYISIVLEFLCRKCGSSTEDVAKGDIDMTKSLFMNFSSRSRHWKRMTFQVLCHMWCCSNTTTGTLTERYCDIWGTWMFVRARDWARWLPGVPSRRSDWIICIYLRMGLPVLGFPWSASSVIGLPGAGFLFAINIYGKYQFEAAFHSKRILLKNGFVVLGFPWSALSVIGLPGTAFPEKLIERVLKQQYEPSNCFAWYCCDLQNDQRRQQEKQKAQFFFRTGVCQKVWQFRMEYRWKMVLVVSARSRHMDAPLRVSSGVRVPCVEQCGKKRLQSKQLSKVSKWGGRIERNRS